MHDLDIESSDDDLYDESVDGSSDESSNEDSYCDPDESLEDYVKIYGQKIISFTNTDTELYEYFNGGFIKTLSDGGWVIVNYAMEELARNTDTTDEQYTMVETNDEYLVMILDDVIYIYSKMDMSVEQFNQANPHKRPFATVNLLEIASQSNHQQEIVVCSDYFYVTHNASYHMLILKFQFDGRLIEVNYNTNEDYSITKYNDRCLLYGTNSRFFKRKGPEYSRYWIEYTFYDNDNPNDNLLVQIAEDTTSEQLYPYKCYYLDGDIYLTDDENPHEFIFVKPMTEDSQLYPAIQMHLDEIVHVNEKEIYILQSMDHTNILWKFSISDF